mgnify:CR=1 FL=1|jgi:hypothetical protein
MASAAAVNRAISAGNMRSEILKIGVGSLSRFWDIEPAPALYSTGISNGGGFIYT